MDKYGKFEEIDIVAEYHFLLAFFVAIFCELFGIEMFCFVIAMCHVVH